MRDHFARWKGFGVTGPSELLAMLEARVDKRLPRSWFQRLAGRILRDDGLSLADEWPVRDERGRLLAELDLAMVELQVGLECQSWKHHGSPAARRADTDRKRRLRGLGWEIVEVWWSDLDRMDAVLADVRVAIARAEAVRQITRASRIT